MRRLALIALAAPVLAAALAVPAAAQERYMGEVFATAATFCPRGSLPADGRILQVSSNQALFALLGDTYGGDGRTTFALPDLRGRSPVHAGRDETGVEVRPGQVIFGAPPVRLDPELSTLSRSLPNEPADPRDYRRDEPLETPGDAPDPALESVAPQPTAGASLGLYFCVAVEGIFPSRN